MSNILCDYIHNIIISQNDNYIITYSHIYVYIYIHRNNIHIFQAKQDLVQLIQRFSFRTGFQPLTIKNVLKKHAKSSTLLPSHGTYSSTSLSATPSHSALEMAPVYQVNPSTWATEFLRWDIPREKKGGKKTRRQGKILDFFNVFQFFHQAMTYQPPDPWPKTQSSAVQYLILPAVARALDNSRDLLPFEALLILQFQGDLFLPMHIFPIVLKVS